MLPIKPTFSKKKLTYEITLDQGIFRTGTNKKIIKDLRSDVTITSPGTPSLNEATVRIYGVSMDDMRQVANYAFDREKSSRSAGITIYAGDENTPFRLHGVAFTGNIVWGSAYPVFSGTDIMFTFRGMTAYNAKEKDYPTTSIAGTVPAHTMIATIAAAIGFSCVISPNATGKTLDNPCFGGDAIMQMRDIALAAELVIFIDGITVYLTAQDEARIATAVEINANTGLIGYPSYSQRGLNFSCVYNNNLRGGVPVNIKSALPDADGLYQVTSATHMLSEQVPNGQWQSNIIAWRLPSNALALSPKLGVV